MSSISRAFTPTNISKGIKLLRKKGLKAVARKLKSKLNSPNKMYGKWYESHKVTSDELDRQRKVKFEYEPLISVIVPVYNPPVDYVKELVESMLEQSYSNWELCLADGGNVATKGEGTTDNGATDRGNTVEADGQAAKMDEVVEDSSGERTAVEELLRDYAKRDSRIRYKKLPANMGISGNTNAAYEMAAGEYIGLLDHDDMLSADCLYEIVAALNENRYDIIYTDEDKITKDSTVHSDPQFKPDFSIDFLRTHNYITHFFVVSRDICEKLSCANTTEGLFRSAYDGAQDYDFILRCVEQTESIYHIPKVLYHWRVSDVSTAGDPYTKSYADEAGLKALEAHIKRCELKAGVEHTDMNNIYKVCYDVTGNPLVSIIIANKDHIEDLDRCIKSIFEKSMYKNYEIIIVENNSEDSRTYAYYKSLKNKYENIKVVNWSKHSGEKLFNYSSINNYGVSFATGEYLLFLNNDTEIISGTAISEMLGCLMRDEIGIVGAKLLFKDKCIQHAGIVLGFGGFAGPVFIGLRDDDLGYMLRPVVNCNYSAVTAACLMIKRSLFDEVGGFDEELAVALNDVDLCLKVREKGKLVTYLADCKWYHYESKSRGYEESPEKQERFEREIAIFKSKWRQTIDAGDPYYNANLSLETPYML